MKNHPAHLFAGLGLLAALCLAAPAAAQAPAGTRPTTLTIATANTPLDRAALRAVAREALGRLGLALEIASLPSERALFAANQGEVDGEGLRVAGLEAQYPQLLRVPEALTSTEFTAFARDRSLRLEGGWPALAPFRVAYITGWKRYEAHSAGARAVTRVDGAEQLFRMLEAGRVDLALYTRADGLALLARLGLAGQVQPVEPVLERVEMYLYLHRRHAELVPRLAQVLRAMKADGSWARLMSRLEAE